MSVYEKVIVQEIKSIRDVFDCLHPYRLYIEFENVDKDNFKMSFYNYNIEEHNYYLIKEVTTNKKILDKTYEGKQDNIYYNERKYYVNARGFNIIQREYAYSIKNKINNNKKFKIILYDMKLVPYCYKIDDNKVYRIMEIYNNKFDNDIINKFSFIDKNKSLFEKQYQLYNYLKNNNLEDITYKEKGEGCFKLKNVSFKYYLSYKIRLVEKKVKFDTININKILNKEILHNLILYHCLLKNDKQFKDLVYGRQKIIYDSSLNKYYEKVYKYIDEFNYSFKNNKFINDKIDGLAEYLLSTFNNNNNDSFIERMDDENYYSIVLYEEFKGILNFYNEEIKELFTTACGCEASRPNGREYTELI